MKKQYKALMLDLDGTTIPNDPKGMPSQRVREAVAKASKKVHVIVVTGRPFFYAKDVIDSLELSGLVVVSGGAQIVQNKSLEILWEKSMSVSETKDVFTILKNWDIEINIQNASTIQRNAFNGLEENTQALSISAHIPFALTEPIKQSLEQFKDIVVHMMPGWEKGKDWLQISHSEATKQHGIFEVAKLLKINTHEIIGVGDGGNDFPLLMACGLKVAMGNAGPELKAIADYIAPTVDDDGVADVIEKFIL